MAQTFKHIVTAIVLALLFTTCASTKRKFVKSKTIKNDSTFTKRDSIVSTTISLGIKDTIFLPISTGNIELDSVLSTRLANFKTGKKSGANSYDIRFDTQAKGFEITSTIKQIQNKIEQKHDSIYQSKATEVRKEHKEVKTRSKVPIWLLIAFLVLLLVVHLLSKFNII